LLAECRHAISSAAGAQQHLAAHAAFLKLRTRSDNESCSKPDIASEDQFQNPGNDQQADQENDADYP
jgi:hypothetical protein